MRSSASRDLPIDFCPLHAQVGRVGRGVAGSLAPPRPSPSHGVTCVAMRHCHALFPAAPRLAASPGWLLQSLLLKHSHAPHTDPDMRGLPLC